MDKGQHVEKMIVCMARDAAVKMTCLVELLAMMTWKETKPKTKKDNNHNFSES